MNLELIENYINEPGKLLIDIDRQLEQAAVEDLPIIVLDGNQKMEKQVIDGQPKHSVMDAILMRSKEKVFAVCCAQLGYCQAREKYSDTVALIQAVGDSLITAYVSFPVPIVTVASYCVLSMFLDRVCECGNAVSPTTG